MPLNFLFCCYRKKRRAKPRQTATIELYTNVQPDKLTSRVGKLSYDEEASRNWIARKLLEEDLKVPWLERRGNEVTKVHGLDMLSEGTVELHWAYLNSQANHMTTFDVTSTYDPPFDVVLGREGIREHGRL